MPTIRRCCIIGCSSNSREKPNLQFFQFPKPESQTHESWKQACKASLSRIIPFKKPVVCALHFSPRCIGGRRLTYSAVPSLRLDVPSNLEEVEQRAMADEIERSRKCAFINAVVYEWLVRANLNPNLRGSITHGMIKDKADGAKTVIMLDSFMPDNRWLNRFRETHLQGFAAKLAEQQLKPLGTSLWIPDIVSDLEHLFPPTSADRLENVPEQYFSYMQQYGEYNDDDECYNQPNTVNGNITYRHNNNNNNNSFNNKIQYHNNNNNSMINKSHNSSTPLIEKMKNCQPTNGKCSPSSSSLSPPFMGFTPIKKIKLSVPSKTSSSPPPAPQPPFANKQHMHIKSISKEDDDEDDVQVIVQPIVIEDLTVDDDEVATDSEVKKLNKCQSRASEAAVAISKPPSEMTRQLANKRKSAPVISVMEALKRNSPRYVLKLKNTSTSSRNGTPDYVSRISPKSFNNGMTDSGYDGAIEDRIVLQTYEDALEYLKPLEDFVLMKENFRAIGLISQLEVILKRGVAAKPTTCQ